MAQFRNPPPPHTAMKGFAQMVLRVYGTIEEGRGGGGGEGGKGEGGGGRGEVGWEGTRVSRLLS